jgi:hypothetical protein
MPFCGDRDCVQVHTLGLNPVQASHVIQQIIVGAFNIKIRLERVLLCFAGDLFQAVCICMVRGNHSQLDIGCFKPVHVTLVIGTIITCNLAYWCLDKADWNGVCHFVVIVTVHKFTR